MWELAAIRQLTLLQGRKEKTSMSSGHIYAGSKNGRFTTQGRRSAFVLQGRPYFL